MKNEYENLPPELKEQYQPETENLEMICLSDIEETEVSWLFAGRVPKGEITIFAADGGTGKTSVVCNLIAAITTGGRSLFDQDIELPEGWEDHKPANVMLFSSEDDFSKVLVSKLKKSGADLNRVQTIEVTDERFEDIKFNSKLLAELLAKHKPVLCVFDPLQSFIPPDVNMGARNEMRNCLNALIGLGRLHETTFIILMHCNKRSGVAGRQRIADSADIWDIVRSVLIFGKADKNGTMYISHEKSNYGKQAETILFKISDAGTAEYQGTSNLKDYDYVLEAAREKSAATPARQEARDFIISQLMGDPNHMIEVKQLDTLAAACGISEGTLKRAKSDLAEEGRTYTKRYGFGKDGKVYLYLKREDSL